jgi:hypothetical protein
VAFLKNITLAMKNCKSVATALNNIAALNLTGAIDKDQWGKVVIGYFLHTVSVNLSDFTHWANQAVASYKQN